MSMPLSSLMDDELDEKESFALLANLRQDPAIREKWEQYHLIGDVLRQHPILSEGFSVKLSQRLADEPPILTPGVSRSYHRPRPFNGASVAVSAAAALAAVSLGVWAVAQMTHNQPQMASSAKVPLQAEAPMSPARLQEYLVVHQEFSPSTTIQGVTPYVRTVAETSRDPR